MVGAEKQGQTNKNKKSFSKDRRKALPKMSKIRPPYHEILTDAYTSIMTKKVILAVVKNQEERTSTNPKLKPDVIKYYLASGIFDAPRKNDNRKIILLFDRMERITNL